MSSRKSAVTRAKDRSRLLARQARMANTEREHATKIVRASLESMRQMLTATNDVLALHEPVTKKDKDKDKTREVCRSCRTVFPCTTRTKLVKVAEHAQAMLNAVLGVSATDDVEEAS